MGVTIECASRFYMALTGGILLLIITNIVAVSLNRGWSTTAGLFSTPDPPTELMVARGMVLFGLINVFLSCVCEIIAVWCTKCPNHPMGYVRMVPMCGCVSGFLGCAISFGQLPVEEEEEEGKAAPLGIVTTLGFVMIAFLHTIMGVFCDNWCKGLARSARRGDYTGEARAQLTRQTLRTVGPWFYQKGQRAVQALTSLRGRGEDSDIVMELEAASRNLSVPPEEIRKITKNVNKVSPRDDGYSTVSSSDDRSGGDPVKPEVVSKLAANTTGESETEALDTIPEDDEMPSSQSSETLEGTEQTSPPVESHTSEKPVESEAQKSYSRSDLAVVEAAIVHVPESEEKKTKKDTLPQKGGYADHDGTDSDTARWSTPFSQKSQEMTREIKRANRVEKSSKQSAAPPKPSKRRTSKRRPKRMDVSDTNPGIISSSASSSSSLDQNMDLEENGPHDSGIQSVASDAFLGARPGTERQRKQGEDAALLGTDPGSSDVTGNRVEGASGPKDTEQVATGW